MPDPPSPELLILCRDVGCKNWLLPIAARRFSESAEPMIIRQWTGNVREACHRIRSEHGGVPLGVVVGSETEGLTVVEAGADDTVLETELDDGSALGFIDRVLLRARLRREQERLRAAYVHSEKLAALGTLVAGVAHEVNNPLTSLLLSAEGLKLRVGPLCNAMAAVERLASVKYVATREELTEVMRVGRTGARPAETDELLQEIESSAHTIARVVRDLKLFARPDDEVAPELVDVRALIDQVLRIVGRQVRAKAILELDYEADLPPIVAPTARLAQVFTNVLLNAEHAISEVERQVHRIRISARADDEAIAISISDTGPGIAPNVVSRIFDPFFTTKRQGVGTGLGLSISRSILRRIGGDLLVESVHGDGATFIVLIPRPDRNAIYEAHRRSSGVAMLRSQVVPKRRVLVVDADEHVLKAVAHALDRQYDVLLARDGQEAIDLLASGSRADLVLADISRPELSGLVLLDWLAAENNPLSTRVIFMSTEEEPPVMPTKHTGCTVLRKPVSRTVLATAIEQLFGVEEVALPRN